MDFWDLAAPEIGLATCAIALALVFVAYNVALVVYRLFFHPLRHFPGPKLNAATLWVDFWYEIVKKGQFTFKFREYHEQYGPIVRINPDELHIMDSYFYDEIYTSSSRPRDKSAFFTEGVRIVSGSAFATIPSDLHRQRRSLLNSYFSKGTILKDVQPIVQAKVRKLLNRFRALSKAGEIIRLDTAFMALTMDVISSYSLDFETNYLDDDDFHIIWQETNRAGHSTVALARHFPWLPRVMCLFSPSIMRRIDPYFANFLLHRQDVRERVERVWYADESKSTIRDAKTMARRSMIHTIRDATHIPESERHPERIVDEEFVQTGAGSETAGRMLSVTSWYLLTQPEILHRLRQEVESVIPPGGNILDVSYATLGGLPYLSAVVSEGLRLSYGPVSRLPRVIPHSSDEKLVYKGMEIPKGTPVSMSGYYVLTDPEIYPEPSKFLPERWLLPAIVNDYTGEQEYAQQSQRFKFNSALTRFLTTFGKGSRACLGMNLAYCEIYMTMAALATLVLGEGTECGLELYETSFDRDVKISHDYFTNFAKDETMGIRAKSSAKTNGVEL